MTEFEKIFERSKKLIADLRVQLKEAKIRNSSLSGENTKLSAIIADLHPKSLDNGAQRALKALEDSLSDENEMPESVTKAKAKRARRK